MLYLKALPLLMADPDEAKLAEVRGILDTIHQRLLDRAHKAEVEAERLKSELEGWKAKHAALLGTLKNLVDQGSSTLPAPPAPPQ